MVLIDRGRVMLDYLENVGRKDSYKAKFEALCKAVDEAPSIDYAPKQQWISVKDRLPEEKTAVLGFGIRSMTYLESDKFPATHIVYSRGEDEGWFTFWNGEYVEVTHWMPLPEPPKEDSK